MHLTIISPGKKLPTGLHTLFDNYAKKLSRMNVRLELLCPDSGKDAVGEGQKILNLIPKGSKVIALDERGHQFSSNQLAGYIEQIKQQVSKVCIVIGGSYGLSPEVIKSADVVLSLGPLTLPHQLVRIITAEQIYRAFSINASLPYHHD
jgi:23S rRNA (pseudouridine1915-N3)-methyltransferase